MVQKKTRVSSLASSSSKIRTFVSLTDVNESCPTLIYSRLNYCNALGEDSLSQGSLHRLQMVLNVTARLITVAENNERITPVLASLHWLPVRC